MELIGRTRAVALTLSAALALAAAATGTSAGATGTTVRTVATLTATDYRAVVVATKTSGGPAPTAAVTAEIYAREGGNWQGVETRRLSGPYFWKTVTAPHALCRLELATAGLLGGARPHLTLQLLRTPSLGCGSVVTIPIAGQDKARMP